MTTIKPKAIVLVVEDEPVQLMMALSFVEDAGFEAIAATNADAAIKILEARTDIRIVFTDVEMPGSMDGLKLAAAVRGRWPPIEIIVTSGQYPPLQGRLPPGGVFFHKPYDEREVISTLQRMAA
jgi:CheY-like chemotaxis protein